MVARTIYSGCWCRLKSSPLLHAAPYGTTNYHFRKRGLAIIDLRHKQSVGTVGGSQHTCLTSVGIRFAHNNRLSPHAGTRTTPRQVCARPTMPRHRSRMAYTPPALSSARYPRQTPQTASRPVREGESSWQRGTDFTDMAVGYTATQVKRLSGFFVVGLELEKILAHPEKLQGLPIYHIQRL